MTIDRSRIDRALAELSREAARLRAARAYVRANPSLLALLDDETARTVCEGVPAKGVA